MYHIMIIIGIRYLKWVSDKIVLGKVMRKMNEKEGAVLPAFLPSLIYSSTDTNLEDEGMGSTSLPTPTFFSNLALKKKVEKLISKSVVLKTPR